MALTSDPQGAFLTKNYLDGKEGQNFEFVFWQNPTATFGPDAVHQSTASTTSNITGATLIPASATSEVTDWLTMKAQVAANEQARYRTGGK